MPHLAADMWSGGSGFFAVLSGPRENSEFVVLSCDIIPIRFDAHLPLAINVITNKSFGHQGHVAVLAGNPPAVASSKDALERSLGQAQPDCPGKGAVFESKGELHEAIKDKVQLIGNKFSNLIICTIAAHHIFRFQGAVFKFLPNLCRFLPARKDLDPLNLVF